MNAEAQRIVPAPIRKTLRVRAPLERAFEVFVGAMHSWWPREHSLVEGRRDIVVEPHVDGRWYEIAADGTESQWGRVLEWTPPNRIVLAWQLNADFAFDPALVTEVEVAFHEEGEETRVEFEHRHLDRLGQEGLAKLAEMEMGMDEGWGEILSLYAQKASGGG
jgi:uncharacterized protein YndB with AHSA1/START domain